MWAGYDVIVAQAAFDLFRNTLMSNAAAFICDGLVKMLKL